MTKRYQVVGIGNAIVDVLTQCDDDFLDWMGIEKGIMQLCLLYTSPSPRD